VTGERTILAGLVSLAGAAGVALLAPVAILLIGTSIALVAGGVIETVSWLVALIVG
jgi:hypothetical protein